MTGSTLPIPWSLWIRQAWMSQSSDTLFCVIEPTTNTIPHHHHYQTMAATISSTSLAATMTLLYGAAIDMVTQLQVRYATSLYAYDTTALVLKVQAEKFAHKNFQFSLPHRNQEDDDDDSVIINVSVANDGSTMYLFTSTQKLVNSPIICSALTKAQTKETLRFLAIDKAHLYAQHRSTKTKHTHHCTDRWRSASTRVQRAKAWEESKNSKKSTQ